MARKTITASPAAAMIHAPSLHNLAAKCTREREVEVVMNVFLLLKNSCLQGCHLQPTGEMQQCQNEHNNRQKKLSPDDHFIICPSPTCYEHNVGTPCVVRRPRLAPTILLPPARATQASPPRTTLPPPLRIRSGFRGDV